ncbi:hypothetical protein PMAYCL1PPCAC_33062, partial [Pristionchus mayeri]
LLYYRYTTATPCEASVSRSFCVVRFLGTSVIPSFVVVHVAMNVQRALSAFRVNTTKQAIVTRVLILISFACAIVYGLVVYWPEPLDGVASYCTSISKYRQWRVILNIHIPFVVDVLNLVASLILWRYNKHKLRSQTSMGLNDKFARILNVHVSLNFLAIEALHTVVYAYLFG